MKSIFWKLWGVPFLLGALSLAGLISALVADGVGDLFSWVTLVIPLGVILWFVIKK